MLKDPVVLGAIVVDRRGYTIMVDPRDHLGPNLGHLQCPRLT